MKALLVGVPLLFAMPPSPQGGDVFHKESRGLAGGEREVFVVRADKRMINCREALAELASTMNWNLVFESAPLENDLRFAPVDLNLADQSPRVVAQLLAVAGGADCVFDDADGYEGARVTLHVVRVPSGETNSGRQRLRSLAGQWYRSFLRDELQYEPLVEEQGDAVRMRLGQLLVDNGDLEGAIEFFTQVYDQRPNDHMARAVLKVAACHLDLAEGRIDREGKLADYAAAESWVRRVFESMPNSPEITPATVLLGRALLGKARHQETSDEAREHARACHDELRARIIRLLDSVQVLHVWLMAGEAQYLLDQPERVYRTMTILRESPYFEDLGPEQFRDYHFLLGFGALGTGKPELAMRALEWFLIHAENDARRGSAYVLLAESYMVQRRFVEARSASIEARERHLATMTSSWRQRALRVWARTALALGEKEGAFLELEQMVLRGEEPELTLFLVDELMRDRQWQRAIAIARVLTDRKEAIGDRARFKTVEALFQQAVASKQLADFPQRAIAIAPEIGDAELRAKVATMIGDAYSQLGKLEHAADAYRGILR